MASSAAQRAAEARAAERARNQRSHQTALNVARAGQGPAKGLPAPQKGIPWPGGSSTAPVPAAAPPPRAPFQWTPDSGYNDAIGVSKRRYDESMGNLDTDERKTKFDFGFDDPTNPFSRVTELKRAFLAQNKGTSVGMAARGHLYSGANLRAVARNKRNQDKGNQDLRDAYEAALEAIRRGREGARTTKEEADLAAHSDSFNRQFAAYNA